MRIFGQNNNKLIFLLGLIKAICSGTSMAQILLAHSTCLARTLSLVPRETNPGWLEIPLAGTNFLGSKPVQVTVVLQYIHIKAMIWISLVQGHRIRGVVGIQNGSL